MPTPSQLGFFDLTTATMPLYNARKGCSPTHTSCLLSEEGIANVGKRLYPHGIVNPGMIDRLPYGNQPVTQRRSSCPFSDEPERLPGTPSPHQQGWETER